MKSRQGFMLVEMMVAITMLGKLLVVAVPSFNAMVGDNPINADSNRITAILSYSRTAASARASVITMERESATAKDWSQGWEIYTDLDATENTTRVGADTLLRNIAPLEAGETKNTNNNGIKNRVGNDISMQPDKFTQTVSFEYIGEGLPPTGLGVDTFVGRIYELKRRAQLTNTGIFSDQTQGLNYADPKQRGAFSWSNIQVRLLSCVCF